MPYYKDEATLGDHIIAFLGSARNSGIYNRIIFERVSERRKSAKRSSVYSELARLKRNGFIEKTDAGWKLTQAGHTSFSKNRVVNHIASPFPPKSPDKILLSFDIPETERNLRDWLRNQLKIFGYRMVQQSLWVGPGPLPKEFDVRIKELNIKSRIRVFHLNSKT